MDQINEILDRYDTLLAEVHGIDPNATLVLATKTVPRETLELLAASRRDLIYGENRVQEFLSKYFTAERLTWHFIGRLQRNKVKYIVDKVSLIQSVDALPLAVEIERQCAKINKVMDILVEVNVGGEESKGGVAPADLVRFLTSLEGMPHLRVRGLMSVLPAADEDILVPLYRMLSDIYQMVKGLFFRGEDFYLSAGMSGDYALALHCGSNMVRIGSKVFGARVY